MDIPLSAGTLSQDCYPASAQAFYDQMFARGHGTIPDIAGILIQDAAPDPADQGTKGWIPTAGNVPLYPGYVFVWHAVVGHWVSRHPLGAGDASRRLYVGTSGSINTYDGGDAGALTIASGPMWEIDPAFAGSVPIGVGVIPGTSGAVSIAAPLDTTDSLGGTGEYKHVLTGAEGAVADHTHPMGVADPASDDAFFAVVGPPAIAVPSYTAHFITGSGHGTTLNETTANLYTLEAADGAGVTSAAHNNMMPYVGVYVLRRTARQFLVAG